MIKTVNKLSLYDENYIYNRQENLNSEYYYFLPSLLILMKNKGHNYEIHNNIKSKNIDKKILNEIILQTEDIDDEDYILFLDNQKKSVATEDEKYKIQKHSLKILYGVDKLNEDILKLEGYQIKNFCGLIDINNISNSKDNQTKEQKKKIEVINELLNNIGFDNIYDNNKYVEKEIIENKRNDIIKNTTIFKDEMIRKVLFNESKYNDDITTNKAFLGYVNTLLDCFCLKIYSDQMRLNKLTKDEKKTMTIEEIEVYNKKREKRIQIYKLERIYNIDEIIDYKIRKGYNLKDEKQIRKDYIKTEIFKDLVDLTKEPRNKKNYMKNFIIRI